LEGGVVLRKRGELIRYKSKKVEVLAMGASKGFELMERDIEIMHLVSRFKFCLGRQIKALLDFGCSRVCDRRLKKLVDFGYLERRHILYGVPSLYFLGKNSKHIGTIKYYSYKLRLDEIMHDIAVLDTAIFFVKNHGLKLDELQSERELHSLDGFSHRRHQPDFVITKDGKKTCVEVEFTPKAKDKMMTNIKRNFFKYDNQIWVVPESENKIRAMIENSQIADVMILSWESVAQYAREK